MKLDMNRLLQRFLGRAMRPKTAVQLHAAPLPVYLPKTHVEAAASLRDPAQFRQVSFLNRRDGLDYTGICPVLVEFLKAFQAELERYGVPMIVTEMLRSAERQNALFAQGRSKARAGSSPHQYGLAFDLVSATKFWNLTPKQWAVIGAIGKEVARKRKIPIEWGGDWDFYDPAHWQLAKWRDMKAVLDREPGLDWGAVLQKVHPALLKR